MCVLPCVSVITQDGISPLMFAAREGKIEGVVGLLKAGANVNMQNRVCVDIMYLHCTCLCMYMCRCSDIVYLYVLYSYMQGFIYRGGRGEASPPAIELPPKKKCLMKE